MALLHLISFAEPFGLAVVEALATGTPVIAHPLGSMPEVVRVTAHTGFLVTDVDSAVARRRRRLGEIDRFAAAPRRPTGSAPTGWSRRPP